MAKVWIVKENTVRSDAGASIIDYTPAMEYGDIEFITSNDMPLYPRSSLQEAWNEDVSRFIREYNPLTDFIVTTGQPIAIFSVGWALGTVGKLPQFLVWRREENRYRVLRYAGLNPDAKIPALFHS